MAKKGDRKNLIGQRFGRLVVDSIVRESFSSNGNFKEFRYLCLCDCGGRKEIPASSLKSGRTNSCGCLHTEELFRRNQKHNLSGSDIFIKYYHMKSRCFNPNESNYKRYGGRGITVCNEWLGEHGFENFVNWSVANGYKEGLSLDRINNDGNYEPSNCRWVVFREQCFNRNNTVYLHGESIAKMAYEHNLNVKTVYRRIKLGWDEKDLFIPPRAKRSS